MGTVSAVLLVNFACQLDCVSSLLSAVGDDDVDDVDDDADADKDITETFSLPIALFMNGGE